MVHVGKRLAALVLILTYACAPHRPPASGGISPRISVRVLVDGRVTTVELDEYVLAAIVSELTPATSDIETAVRMFEVQAIVSRTYALSARRHRGFDLCATSHCQLYDPSRLRSSRWAPAARWAAAAADAVHRTAGVIVWFGDRPAKVAFHADCGGRTSAARDVWSGDDPVYLAAVSDDGPAAAAHKDWRLALSMPELLNALNRDSRTRVGNRLDRIDVLRRDAAGRAQLVALAGERAPVVRGEELRVVLTEAFGARTLRSTRFEVTRTNLGFQFTGRGFGHGVGLCQAGAFARVTAGASAAEVLAYYFPGTSIH